MRNASHLALAAACLALAACNQAATTDNGAARSTATTTPTGSATAPGAATGSDVTIMPPAQPAPAAAAANPALAQQMSLAAQQLSAQLPMRADAMTSVTGIRAEGTEFIYQMSIEQALPMSVEEAQQRMQASNQANLCRDASTSQLIRMGASMRHDYRDSAGKTFQTRVTSCP